MSKEKGKIVKGIGGFYFFGTREGGFFSRGNPPVRFMNVKQEEISEIKNSFRLWAIMLKFR